MELRLKSLLVALIATLVMVAGGCVPSTPTLAPTPTPTPAATPTPTPVPRQSKIAIMSVQPVAPERYNVEILVMDPDGSNVVNLTNHPGIDSFPSWSPDGSRIAFWSYRDGNWGVYVMNYDGTGAALLAKDAGPVNEAVWAPDGARIVYASERGIRVISFNGADDVEVSGVLAKGMMPVWSPDGRKIAFDATGADGAHSMRTMDADGSNQVELAKGVSPQWSPDSTKIAFKAPTRPGIMGWDILTVNSDGSGITNLTNSPAQIGMPLWSPDGSKIAYRAQDGNGTSPQFYVMNSDGSGHAKVASFTMATAGFPSWSPDGTKLAFSVTGADDIRGTYTVSADGSDLRRIIMDGDVGGTVWSPWIGSK